MGRSRNPQNPPCPRCGASETASKGRKNERPRWRCLACGRSFGETLGTPLYRLKTDSAEIVRAIQVVLHRGSLRAAEEQTGHNYETIAVWLERLGDHAEAVTELLVRDLALTEVEVDELWSFVGKKGGAPRQRGQAILRQTARESAGAARAWSERAASSWPGQAGPATTRWPTPS
jgi:transposase-like protein